MQSYNLFPSTFNRLKSKKNFEKDKLLAIVTWICEFQQSIQLFYQQTEATFHYYSE